ncbi:COX3-domain-containing protein, partial [Basidiobolus meristosporus CBS 931.73]
PLAALFALLVTTLAAVSKFHGWIMGGTLLTMGIIAVALTMAFWWRDCIRESAYQGFHTTKVQNGITMGFVLFVISEVFFFISIFWGYFHSSLAPTVELGPYKPAQVTKVMNGILTHKYHSIFVV